MSSPTRPAASVPASTAARTLPTSPRTIVVTYAPPIWIVLTTSTLAALHIASVASTRPTQPLVSTRPSAEPYEPFPSSAIGGFSGESVCVCIDLPFDRSGRRSCALLLGHHPAQL